MKIRATLLIASAGMALVASAACSSGGSSGGGSPTPTSGANVITVTGVDGSPRAGVAVVVDDSAGEVASSTQTGADGTSVVTIPANGSVTVLDTDVDGPQAQTVIAPPPGIALTFLVNVTPAPASTPTPQSATINLTLTFAGGVQSVAIFADCNAIPIIASSVTQGTTSVQQCDAAQTTWDFFAWGYDGTNGTGNRVAWGQLLDQPASFGGTLDASLDIVSTAVDTVDVGHAALPFAADSRAYFGFRGDASGALSLNVFAPATLPNSAAPQSMPGAVPHGTTFTWLPVVDVTATSASNGTTVFFHEDWKATGAAPSSFTLDPSARAIVAIGALDLTDNNAPEIHFTPGAGTTGVAGTAEIHWVNGGTAARRDIVFPATITPPLIVPKLRASDTNWIVPAQGSGAIYRWSLAYDDVDALTSWSQWLTTDRATLASYDHFVSGASVP